MSDDPVRRTNLAAITCDPRPQLPDGFRRNSTRLGAALGAARTGLSVYELPPGQAPAPTRRRSDWCSTRATQWASQLRDPRECRLEGSGTRA